MFNTNKKELAELNSKIKNLENRLFRYPVYCEHRDELRGGYGDIVEIRANIKDIRDTQESLILQLNKQKDLLREVIDYVYRQK